MAFEIKKKNFFIKIERTQIGTTPRVGTVIDAVVRSVTTPRARVVYTNFERSRHLLLESAPCPFELELARWRVHAEGWNNGAGVEWVVGNQRTCVRSGLRSLSPNPQGSRPARPYT